MRSYPRLAVLALVGLLFLISSCATLNGRIRKNRDLYETYTTEVQAMLAAGQVGRGMDSMQVYMAVGNPASKEDHGGGTVWTYTTTESRRVKHEKGAVEYQNDMYKYKEELEAYTKKKEAGEFAIEPTKPSAYYYETQRRTRVVRRVYFDSDGRVTEVEEPSGEYLGGWS